MRNEKFLLLLSGNAHLTLEQQIMTLESAQTQQVAVGALAAGVTAQKALNQQL